MIAIIGSTSFTGKVFKELAKKTHDVVTLDRCDGYNFEEPSTIINKLGEVKPNIIVNFASQNIVADSWKYPELYFKVNTTSQVELHHWLSQVDWLDRYIHVSTPEVYGHTETLRKEDFIYRPSTPYASSRAACDMSLMNHFYEYGLPVVFTRSANVYGFGQQPYRIIPAVIKAIRYDTEINIDGRGDSLRSYVHVSDVAEGTLLCTKAKPGNVYHFSTDTSITTLELVNLIGEVFKLNKPRIVFGPERPGKDKRYWLDSSKAKDELGWCDRISLVDGILSCI